MKKQFKHVSRIGCTGALLIMAGVFYVGLHASAEVVLVPSIGPSPVGLGQASPPPAPPVEPYIAISPDVFYPLDEILYVEGRSDPNALVTLELQKAGDKPVKFTVKADSSGEWVVAEKTYLSAGNWEVRAKQQSGALVSGWANPRVVRSVVTGVSIFGLSIRYVVIAAVSLLFLLTVVVIYLYFRRKIRGLERGAMEKELRETEARFHRGFAEIRKDLMDQLKDLAANSEGRSLTSGEIEKRDHILRELEELEQGLEHDVGDISRRY